MPAVNVEDGIIIDENELPKPEESASNACTSASESQVQEYVTGRHDNATAWTTASPHPPTCCGPTSARVGRTGFDEGITVIPDINVWLNVWLSAILFASSNVDASTELTSSLSISRMSEPCPGVTTNVVASLHWQDDDSPKFRCIDSEPGDLTTTISPHSLAVDPICAMSVGMLNDTKMLQPAASKLAFASSGGNM